MEWNYNIGCYWSAKMKILSSWHVVQYHTVKDALGSLRKKDGCSVGHNCSVNSNTLSIASCLKFIDFSLWELFWIQLSLSNQKTKWGGGWVGLKKKIYIQIKLYYFTPVELCDQRQIIHFSKAQFSYSLNWDNNNPRLLWRLYNKYKKLSIVRNA